METKVKIDGYRDRSIQNYVDLDKIFFTSDTHWGHTNVIKFQGRPFKHTHDMDETMIRNWNEVVPWDGVVFHLGDVSLMAPGKSLSVLERLNGKIYLIKGNHEKSVLRKQSTRDKFEWIRDKYELQVGKQLIVMCHYAHRVWNKSHHGSFHLYGHSHGSMEEKPWGKSMDVGVDSWDYKPLSYYDVERVLSKRKPYQTDKHEIRE
jgi:calcineurin-like phosphoesterase family protein